MSAFSHPSEFSGGKKNQQNRQSNTKVCDPLYPLVIKKKKDQ